MNKIILILSFLISVAAQAQNSTEETNIKFDNIPYKELLTKAKKEKKLLFIDAYAEWCGPCKLMVKNIFTQKSVSDYYNSSFINSSFDMEKGEGREIAQKFGVRSYPTFLFINGDGELVYQSMGYMDEKEFLALGKQANNPANKQGTMKDRFLKGEKDPDFLINIMKLNSSTDFEFAKQASERYFQNKKTKEFTKDELGLLLYFIKSADDSNFKIFSEQKNEITKIMPLENYDEFGNQFRLLKIMQESIDNDKKTVREDYFLSKAVPLIGETAAKRALNQTKLSFYEQTANFPEFEKTALEYFKNPNEFDSAELLKAAWIFAENVTNIKSLKTAQIWAEKSVMQGENIENTYILAKLYFKTGNKSLAKDFASISQKMATQSGKDATLATQLLDQIK